MNNVSIDINYEEFPFNLNYDEVVEIAQDYDNDYDFEENFKDYNVMYDAFEAFENE